MKYAEDMRKFIRSSLFNLNSRVVLDAGCGNGLVTRLIKKQHPKIKLIGIDSDANDIKIAKRKERSENKGINYFIGSLDKLPFPDSSFDLVVATLVFHHMEPVTRKLTLKEFYRVLNSHGEIIILEGKGLVRNLVDMMENSGFRDIGKRKEGKIRNVYYGKKIQFLIP